MQPKLIGYMCKSGAYALYETGHPMLRSLPRDFQALPVVHLQQVGVEEIAKAFRLGAAGVLLVGCEACHAIPNRDQLVLRHAALVQEVVQWGGSLERLVLAWYTAAQPDKFFETVARTMANVQRFSPLRLSPMIDDTIAHCG